MRDCQGEVTNDDQGAAGHHYFDCQVKEEDTEDSPQADLIFQDDKTQIIQVKNEPIEDNPFEVEISVNDIYESDCEVKKENYDNYYEDEHQDGQSYNYLIISVKDEETQIIQVKDEPIEEEILPRDVNNAGIEANEDQAPDCSYDGRRPFMCPYCPKSFRLKIPCQAHIRLHTGKRSFECSHCSESFTRFRNLKEHTWTHFVGEDRGESIRNPFQCAYCPDSFRQKDSCREHTLLHTGERPFKCAHCLKCFMVVSRLKAHIKTHSEGLPFKCLTCAREFSKQKDLDEHRLIHTGENPFMCPYCTKSFTANSRLQTHIRSHTGERPYKCNTCSQSFTVNSDLTRHHRLKHSGFKPLKCPHCRIAFKKMVTFRKHILKHSS